MSSFPGDKTIERKIVVYDSGIGGKFIYNECKKRYSKVEYFQDKENFPYGKKDFYELKKIFINNLNKLNLKKDDLLVLACNTISCVYKELEEEIKSQLISVIDYVMKYPKDLIICTEYTSKYLTKLGIKTKQLEGLAEYIENEKIEEITILLQSLSFKEKKIVYGCTHYPIIDEMFKVIHSDKEFINPEKLMLKDIESWIQMK